ncbi:MAG: hypothetical protein ACLU9S_14740 [Oscillospiraceae bacterium]
MSNETLRETLLFQPKHGYERLTPAQKEEMESYCKDYAAFMDAAKTEREAVTYTVAAAEKAGFRPSPRHDPEGRRQSLPEQPG